MKEVWEDLQRHKKDPERNYEKIQSMLPKKYRKEVCGVKNLPTELANYMFEYREGDKVSKIYARRDINSKRKKGDVYLAGERHGYAYISYSISGVPFTSLEHILVMNIHGKYIGKNENVDHINGKPLDNWYKNLRIVKMEYNTSERKKFNRKIKNTAIQHRATRFRNILYFFLTLDLLKKSRKIRTDKNMSDKKKIKWFRRKCYNSKSGKEYKYDLAYAISNSVYYPKTGVLVGVRGAKMVKCSAGGYITLDIRLYGEKYAHVFIFKHMLNKYVPDGYVVDHKDRNPINNKEDNLRAVPLWINSLNRKRVGDDFWLGGVRNFERCNVIVQFNGRRITSKLMKKKKAIVLRDKVVVIINEFLGLSDDEIVDENVWEEYEQKLVRLIEKGKNKLTKTCGNLCIENDLRYNKYTLRYNTKSFREARLTFPINKSGIKLVVGMKSKITEIRNKNILDSEKHEEVGKVVDKYKNKREEIKVPYGQRSIERKEAIELWEWAQNKYPESDIRINHRVPSPNRGETNV